VIVQCLPVLIGVAALAVLSEASAAPTEDAFSDGKTCFCLRHETTQQVMKNCTGEKSRNDFYVTATCKGLLTGGKPSPITVQPPWTAIPAGSEGCEVCAPKQSTSVPELPRGSQQ
jgi:hypothetical protein